jgi:hypothetical protein
MRGGRAGSGRGSRSCSLGSVTGAALFRISKAESGFVDVVSRTQHPIVDAGLGAGGEREAEAGQRRAVFVSATTFCASVRFLPT